MYKLIQSRYNAGRTTLFGRPLLFNNAFWYLHGLDGIFFQETYKFISASPTPRIIDCGANIGLSAIFFKRLYPEARLTAFEPAPDICALLRENLQAFGYDDVEIRQEAVWTKTGNISFIASGGVGGRIGEADIMQTLPAKRLRDLLSEPVDFLKIDIEGAEGDVIQDCADALRNVKHIFIEYHSSESKEQELDAILCILREVGFRYYLKEAWENQPKPYTNKRDNLFDLQLNIFGYRQ